MCSQCIAITLKELRCSAQVSHEVVDSQEVMYDLYLMVGWLMSIEYLGIQWGANSLHRSLSYISASLSHKFGLFYFALKFIILSFLHQ